jgi:hypothetical protein
MAERLTSADVVAINSSEEMIGVILQVAKQVPELAYLAASPISKTKYSTLVRTALPTAGFRAINAGRDRNVGTVVSRTVECKYLDASWDADNAALSGIDWGDPIRDQQVAHMLAAMKSLQRQIYDGTGADAAGFPGYASLFPNSDSPGVIDAGGTTGSTGSSVYLVKTGEQDACLAWGNDGRVEAGEVYPTQLTDGDGKTYHGKAQSIEAWAGLQITNHNSLVRICNITEDADKTLDDDLIYKALMLFGERYGVMPDHIWMSYRSLKQLRSSRTATNATGQPAPIPRDVEGVPVIPTLGITNTETLLTAA